MRSFKRYKNPEFFKVEKFGIFLLHKTPPQYNCLF